MLIVGFFYNIWDLEKGSLCCSWLPALVGCVFILIFQSQLLEYL